MAISSVNSFQRALRGANPYEPHTPEEPPPPPDDGPIVSIAFTATGSTRAALPGERVVRMYATVSCWIKTGDITVTVDGTDGIFFAAGTEISKYAAGDTYIAVRGEVATGNFNITSLPGTSALAFDTTVQLAYTSLSANVQFPLASRIRVYAPTGCYFLFGSTSGVTVTIFTGTFFAAGTEVLEVPSGDTYIAMVQHSTAGSSYITRMV